MLSHFPKGLHSFLTRLFEDAYDSSFYRQQVRPRKRAENLTEMLENLERDLEVRARAGSDLGMRESILDSELESDRKAFARMIAKEMQRKISVAGKMSDLPAIPPTEKQLEFLRKLGFRGKVTSKGEASRKIESLKGTKQNA